MRRGWTAPPPGSPPPSLQSEPASGWSTHCPDPAELGFGGVGGPIRQRLAQRCDPHRNTGGAQEPADEWQVWESALTLSLSVWLPAPQLLDQFPGTAQDPSLPRPLSLGNTPVSSMPPRSTRQQGLCTCSDCSLDIPLSDLWDAPLFL